MIVNSTSYGNTASATSTSDASSSAAMGKDDFLTLLLTQMQNQDPLSPMDNTEFTAQMATFSSLEQLTNVNENLGYMLSSMNSSTSMAAVDMIGREVTAEGQNVHIKDGNASDIAYYLPEDATNVEIVIEDENGSVVKILPAGTQDAGDQLVSWDGLDDSGSAIADGLYKFNVVATNSSDELMEVETFTTGVVTGVQYEENVAYVYIGNAKYMLSEILEVRAVDSSTADTTTDTTTGDTTSALDELVA